MGFVLQHMFSSLDHRSTDARITEISANGEGFIYLFIYSIIYIIIYLFILNLFIYLFICLFIYLFIN